MPWKNGLGTTAEIAIDPPGADLAGSRFRWRLSIASVDQSCAFSAFPGYDRTIMVIAGNGMVLTVSGQAARRMDRCHEPFSFSGDDPVDCQLIDGPIRDFNLMVDRAVLAARTTIVTAVESPQAMSFSGQVILVHCLSGTLRVSPVQAAHAARLAAGDTLGIEAAGSVGEVQFHGGGRSIAAVMELGARGGVGGAGQ